MKWLIGFILFPCFSFSQIEIDKLITFQEVLDHGIILRSIQDVEIYKGTQYIRILDIDLNKANILFDLFQFGDRSGPKYLSDAMKNLSYDAAINGSYFNQMGFPSCFTQVDGKVYSLIQGSGLVAFKAENGAWALTSESRQPVILKKPFFGWRLMPEYEDILTAGPLLVYNGTQLNSIYYTHGKNLPRSAIGLTEDNHFIAVTVAGDKENILGMTINQLAEFMQSLGCHAALNLGGTNVLWIKEQGGIVNLLYKNDNLQKSKSNQELKYVEPANTNAIVIQWIIKP